MSYFRFTLCSISITEGAAINVLCTMSYNISWSLLFPDNSGHIHVSHIYHIHISLWSLLFPNTSAHCCMDCGPLRELYSTFCYQAKGCSPFLLCNLKEASCLGSPFPFLVAVFTCKFRSEYNQLLS